MSGFALERFRAAALAPREERVPVPDLASFFEDTDPVWVVRGLTGEEIARANESSQRSQSIAAAVEALVSTAAAKGDQVAAVKELLGHGDDVPLDLAKRFDHLVSGSVDPAIDRSLAVRLAASYPIVFFQLTNKILELTGRGPDVGKPPSSTPIPESEQP